MSEDIKGFTPQFIDALMAAWVTYLFSEFKRLRKALAALAHQFIVLIDFYSLTFQVDDAGEDIGSTIE